MQDINVSRMALLIDGDNAQPRLIGLILEEASKFGKVTIRRVYGDWTQQNMNGWKIILNEYAINPIQKFSYTTGKNSTDSALIIDAMDILHGKLVDGFCIVSSDSDYTGLSKRIREDGTFVLGVGEQKTPKAFVHSCDNFTFVETLIAAEEEVKLPEEKQKTKAEELHKSAAKLDLNILNKAFNMVVGDNETAYLSEIGLGLRKLDSSFDHRTYGFKSLAELFRSLKKEFEVINNNVNGMKVYLVKRR
ncbi:MAG: NYN domain-containing protein [Chitinophagales bacterium]|nr:NYN domain-containing protein [Chitinophagales bacterium]